jgi:Flp pilus assembly protein TadD/predicted  nucleic acid-binding Zn-ribbon protein
MSKYLFMPLLACILAMGVLAPIVVHADPQQDFLQIYLLIQEGDKLESDGQAASARTRYEDALKRLQQLPEGWEAGIVSYRIKYCREKIAKLKDSRDANPSASSNNTTTATSSEPSTGSPAPTPPSNDEINKLNERIHALEKEVKQTKILLSAAQEEAKDLRTKLSSAQEQLASYKNANTDQKMADLLNENASLKDKLTKAEDQIKNLQETGGKNAASVPALQAQLKKVQEQLAAQQAANVAFEQTNADLKRQLEDAQKNLAEARQQISSAQNPDAYKRENDVLRGIINRQMQEQARRDVAKKIAQEQLDGLKINSETLRQQIDILGSPVMVLSEEERSLLLKPTVQINGAGSNNVSVPLVTTVNTASTTTSATTGETASHGTVTATASTPAATTTATTTTATAEPVTPTTAIVPNASQQFTNPETTASNSTLPPPTAASETDFRTKPRIPNDVRQLAQEASDLFAQKRYDEAAAVYQKMIDKYPESLYAWSNLGVVRFQQQNFPEAQKALAQAVKLSPTDAFSHSILGIVYYSLGKYDDAVSTLTRAKALDPNDAKTRNYLGIACSQKGWQEAAEQELRKAIEIDPNYGDAHFNLAVIYATQKPPAKELARKHYKQAQDLGIPKDPQLEKLLQ